MIGRENALPSDCKRACFSLGQRQHRTIPGLSPGTPGRARLRSPRMAITRENLYEEVWAEPMTKVAARYDVSSSFLARVCKQLNVPRPPPGYWPQLKVGKASPKPSLPEARPGDELEWSREGEPRRVPRALPQPPAGGAPARHRTRRERPSRHELLVGAREHFEGAKVSDSGYLRPLKKRLVDMLVTKAMLDHALDVANALFLALEDRGHSVTLAPLEQQLQRPEVDERSEALPERYRYVRWRPDRATVVYVGTVAIGLTLFELSEEVEVRYAAGKYVRVVDLPPPTPRRRWSPAPAGTHKRDMPSGRLCLRASSPYALASWEKQWRETKGSDLSSKVPHIVRELEAEVATFAALVAEGERQAEIERRQLEAQQAKWRAEEAERRRVQNIKESREHLFAIIERWGVAKQVEGFFEDAERRAAGLGESDKNDILERLRRARELLGGDDALQRFRAWRAPDER